MAFLAHLYCVGIEIQYTGVMNVDHLIATRVRDLRKARGYTLDELADLSGVSRSAISLIEREETSPTAVVLNKLADALGVTLAALFSDAPGAAAEQPLARLSEQQIWTDPGSGGELSSGQKRRLRKRDAQRRGASAGLGARRRNGNHRGRPDMAAAGGGLPRHGA
jgi:transcriptional regulator with XRE-family HTH domain